LRVDTALTSDKVKYKVKEIRNKIEIEQKVKSGTERMIQVLDRNDSYRYAQAADKMLECTSKIQLLQKSIQRYQSISVVPEEEGNIFYIIIVKILF
jgi:hypothetical protein